MPPSYSQSEWDEQKERVIAIYSGLRQKDENLNTLRDTMWSTFGFDASPNQYQTQLDRWGFRKYLTKEDSRIVTAKTNKRRRLEDKDSEVTLFGQKVSKRRLETAERAWTAFERARNPIEQYEEKPTPPGVIVQTPPGETDNNTRYTSPENGSTSLVPAPRQDVPPISFQPSNIPSFQFQSKFTISVFASLIKSKYSTTSSSGFADKSNRLQNLGLGSSTLIPRSEKSVNPISSNLHSPLESKISPSGELVSFGGGVFDRYFGDIEDRRMRLADSKTTDSLHEVFCFIFRLISNNVQLSLFEESDLIEWISNQNQDLLRHCFDLEDITVQASMEWLVRKAFVRYDKSLGRALLGADINCKLFPARSARRLQAACAFEHLPLIRSLLDEGVDVNTNMGTFAIPVTILSLAKSPEIAKLLLRANADIDARSFEMGPIPGKLHLTPLQRAIENGNNDLVKLFLQWGAAFNPRTILQYAMQCQMCDMPEVVRTVLNEANSSTLSSWKAPGIRVLEKDLEIAAHRDVFSDQLLPILLESSSGAKLFASNREVRAKLLVHASTQSIGTDRGLAALIKYGSNVNTPATLHDSTKAIISRFWLVKHLKYLNTDSRSNKDLNPADLYTPLLAAVESGSMTSLKFLLDNQADVNTKVFGRLGSTVLETALRLGLRKMALLLIEYGAETSNSQVLELKNLSLAQAAKENNLPLARTLISEGANPIHMLDGIMGKVEKGRRRGIFQMDDRYIWGRDGSHWNEMLDFFRCVCGDIDAKSPDRKISALECAVEARAFNTAQSLVNAGAKVTKLTIESAIFAFVHGKFDEEIQFIKALNTKGAVNGRGKGFFNKETLPGDTWEDLDALKRKRTLVAVRTLVESGLDINRDLFEESRPYGLLLGRAVYMVCEVSEYPGKYKEEIGCALELVRYLLSAGAKVDGFQSVVTVTNCSGGQIDGGKYLKASTPLQIAAGHTHINMALIQILLDAGADINAPPEAADSINIPTIQIVLDLSASLDDSYTGSTAERGWTALQGAAMRGHTELVHFLLERGAQVNAAGAEQNGRTALQGAAENGHLDTVQLLLDAGAESLVRAAALADDERHYVVAELLRREIKKRSNELYAQYDRS